MHGSMHGPHLVHISRLLVSIDSLSPSLMIFVPVSQFCVYSPCLGSHLAQCLKSVLNVKTLVGTFNQVKALAGAFYVIVKLQYSRRFA